jgi:hypothetical protein
MINSAPLEIRSVDIMQRAHPLQRFGADALATREDPES